MIDLSVIIVSYNTSQLTKQCIKSINSTLESQKDLAWEIIIVDNNSDDESVVMLSSFWQASKTSASRIPSIKVIFNQLNVGFGNANNIGIKSASGKYLLLLNSDTKMVDVDFHQLLTYLNSHQDIGGLTVRVKFPNGTIDPASHRGFPTIWRSLCYFTGFETITNNTPLNRYFGGYHLTNLDLEIIHEIDSPSGAFFLIPKKIFDSVGGFDEQFFMYGEDLDLAMRIKKQGYKIIYYPKYSIIHYKHQSGLRGDKNIKATTKRHFYDAMKIFYTKHYSSHHSQLINNLIYFMINFKSRF